MWNSEQCTIYCETFEDLRWRKRCHYDSLLWITATSPRTRTNCEWIWSLWIAHWAPSQYNDRLSRHGIPMLKIRFSQDRLIFNMGINTVVRRHLYIETVSRFLAHFMGSVPSDKCLQRLDRYHTWHYTDIENDNNWIKTISIDIL